MATIHCCKFPLCQAPFPTLPPPSSGVQAVLCHLSPQPCCRSSRWLGACQLLQDTSLSCMSTRAMEKVLPGCFQGFWLGQSRECAGLVSPAPADGSAAP